MKKINICIDYNKRKPLLKWHNDRYTNNFFKDNRFSLIQWKDFRLGDNNFLFLYCVPDETMEFLVSMGIDFYETIKKKNIKILFQNEQFNLFMFDGNIFENVPHIKYHCYDINEILYWKITNFFRKYNIGEENLFFVHSAKGFLDEIKQMQIKKIKWIDSTLNLKSKHIQLNSNLMWGSEQVVEVVNKIKHHYACLFAGRPSLHRHDLIKKLWKKKLLNFGRCSLSHYNTDDVKFAKLSLPPIGKVNSHTAQAPYEESDVFQNIFLWIAGETYCANGYPYFTEKTVKAILYERPFISFGNTGTLTYLKDFGFKTFSAYWDESYDNEKNDVKKIEMIANVIQGICEKNLLDINRMYNDMKPILEHNKNLLVNTDWRKELVTFLS
jgi:hypothetical protein